MKITLGTMALAGLIAALGVSVAGPDAGTASIPAFLDTNGDDKIDTEERLAFIATRTEARKGLTRMWDTNQDGIIDDLEQEMASDALRAKMHTKRTELFTGIAGVDGVLTLEEFGAIPILTHFPADFVTALYDFLDDNNDDEVSLEEFLSPLD